MSTTEGTPTIPEGSEDPTAATLRGDRYVDVRRASGADSVFEAFDARMQRPVTVEQLGSVGPRGQAFLREALVLARVSHPNLVRIYDAGVTDGVAHVVMERVRGRSLAERAPRRWRAVCAVYLDVARALAAVHAQRLVHRDVHPGNIIVGEDGRVKLLGLRLSRYRDDEAPSTVPDASATLHGAPTEGNGPLRFIAPEQHEGAAPHPTADVFALCCSMLTTLGGAPFEGREVEIVAAKRAGPPRIPPEVPASLAAVLRRGLAPDPADRHRSASALAEALSAVLGRRSKVRNGLLVGVSAVTLSALGWSLGAAQRNSACEDVATHPAWTPTHRDRLTRAFTGSPLAYAPDVLPEVLRSLDAHAQAWHRVAEASCEATRIRAEASEGVLQARRACLDEVASDLEVRVELLAAADARTLEHAHRVAANAASATRCTNLGALQREADRAPQGATSAALRRASAWIDAGQPERAHDLLGPALDPSAPPPIRAQALVLQGRASLARGAAPQAQPVLEEALSLALRHDEDPTAMAAALAAAHARLQTGDVGEARAFVDVARGLAQADESDADARAKALVARARLAAAHGDLDEALALLGDAAERHTEQGGPDSLAVAGVLAIQAELAGSRPEAAEALLRRASILERRLGSRHPATVRAHARARGPE